MDHFIFDAALFGVVLDFALDASDDDIREFAYVTDERLGSTCASERIG